MQTNDARDQSHPEPRPETTGASPVPAVGQEPATPHAELEVPLARLGSERFGFVDAGQHALRRRDELSPERVESIRQRVLDGVYASDAVLDTVARRILKSRDL